ncbi:hypothetical protein [Pseudoalteromonas sp. P1-8]|uniref:hypothetical protein n=1 Tax=Pseudoalteromonas sp. P1-8 TaxID=1710353 RepID=UPI0006DCEA55|nr:hypothetical protein [Pseudoalteromonas sp. P1-8]KPW01973.1 hypothetical protein AN213_01429 [Pseudoalteromonas sp. P1-8]
MIPAVLYRGAKPNISVQKICNYNDKEPLGPGIYATDSKDTLRYYTNGGKSAYKLVIDSNYLNRVNGVIELSKKFSEQKPDVKDKLSVVLKEHYGFLDLDESKGVVDLLFDREQEVNAYNLRQKQEHEDYFDGSLMKVPHLIAKIFFDFLKPKACQLPQPKVAPTDEDIVESLISEGIWIGVGSIEGSITQNGAMDAGMQYLFYDENAISENKELGNEV